jgi:cytochrome c-type biogenesis protein CcmF
MDTVFIGEHLWPGKLGQFFVVLSFAAALLATLSYYFETIKDKPDGSWLKIARSAYFVNLMAIIGIGTCLFYIIYNHLFEYHYAWAHSSKALPVYYIISCFWEGQEGSFWLWTFWQSVLGFVLVFRAKTWEPPVMAVVMLSQTFLASMLLGVEILGIRVGSSPFILLRDAVQAPIFARPDYLSMVADGNGLNPLLQNYWMVIHPPTLFLGFASMIVPFAYALAGLWQKRYTEWISVALPWALFAVMVLGSGRKCLPHSVDYTYCWRTRFISLQTFGTSLFYCHFSYARKFCIGIIRFLFNTKRHFRRNLCTFIYRFRYVLAIARIYRRV